MILLGITPALAWSWYAPDPAAAEAVRAAIPGRWTDEPITVVVGVPDPVSWLATGGVWEHGDLLRVRMDGVRRVAYRPADAEARVTLVRAVVRSVGQPLAGGGEPARGPEPVLPAWALGVGPGLAVRAGGAPVHLSTHAELSWRSVWLGANADADLGSSWHADIHGDRLGASVLGGLRLPLWSGHLEWGLGAGARWTRLASGSESAARLTPTLVERAAWYRHIGPVWEAGVGLVVALDDPANGWEAPAWEFDEASVAPVAASAALELTIGRRALPGSGR